MQSIHSSKHIHHEEERICIINYPGDSRPAFAGTGLSLGIKAGANLFKVDGESFDQEFQFGYMAGAFTQINVYKSWGIQPELNFNQTNYRTVTVFHRSCPMASTT
jgi:hypothetical protein